MECRKIRSGLTLVEVIVGSAIFALIAVAVYQSYAGLFDLVRTARTKTIASALANEQFEIARNMPYADVGIVNGVPAGKIPHIQTLIRDGISFTVTASVKAIDDPADGLIGAGDTSFAPDSKLAEVEIACTAVCKNFTPLIFTMRVAPQAFESFSNNGALLVNVFDANGIPVSGARVQVINTVIDPDISIDDETDNSGQLFLTDVPPANQSYEIIVSKTGYSTERTYPIGGNPNANPNAPHATVVAEQVTQKSFSIDRTGTINVASARQNCVGVPSIDFTSTGAKTIGTDAGGSPLYKNTGTHVTDGSGNASLTPLEWDTYALDVTDAGYDLAGTMSPLPIALAPNSTQNATLVVEPEDPQSVLITVKDASTNLPLKDATVRFEGGGFDETLITGRGFLGQSDWSGGAGQGTIGDATQFFSTDGNVDYSGTPGELKLGQFGGDYYSSGVLTSSTFDTGSESNFYQMLWSPTNQPPQTGADPVKFQIATNNDNTTWNFVGPDGTSGSFFTLGNQNIDPGNNSKRYFRYKLFLSTGNDNFTPTLGDISFTYTSTCVPPGQVFFHGLSNGTYNLTVTKAGYTDYTDIIDVSSAWKNVPVTLAP